MRIRLPRGYTTVSEPHITDIQRAVRRLFRTKKLPCTCHGTFACASCEVWLAVGLPAHARPDHGSIDNASESYPARR